MKRIVLALVATVVGVVALLSFKSHEPATTGPSGLPSAAVPGAAAAANNAPAASPATSGAPPDPSASPSGPSPSTASTPHPGSATYTGSAIQTRYGVIQVRITVSGARITNVGFVQLTAFDGRSQQINADAAPTLLQETLSAQSARIDSVSGATYTSDGYEQSLQSALDQAGIR